MRKLRYYRGLAGPLAYLWAVCGALVLIDLPKSLYRGEPLWACFYCVSLACVPGLVRSAIAKHAGRVVGTYMAMGGMPKLDRAYRAVYGDWQAES